MVATVLVAVAAGFMVLPLLPFTPLPAAPAWPYIVASAIIHVVYFVTLAEAYRWGDLSQVYPIARGTAPLLTAALAALWLQEALGSAGWAGVTVLAGGILLLTFKGGRTLARVDSRAVAFALATSLTITAYTLVDGIGARLAGSSLAYTVWLFIGDGVTMAIYGWLRIGPALMGDLRAHWRIAVAGARAFDGGLCDRHLGHDGGADRVGGGAARDQRAVRRSVCHCHSARTATAGPPCGRRFGLGWRPVVALSLGVHLAGAAGAGAAAGAIEPVWMALAPAAGDGGAAREGRSGRRANCRQSRPNQLSCGNRRCCKALHSDRDVTPSTKILIGGASRKAITVATAMAAVGRGGADRSVSEPYRRMP